MISLQINLPTLQEGGGGGRVKGGKYNIESIASTFGRDSYYGKYSSLLACAAGNGLYLGACHWFYAEKLAVKMLLIRNALNCTVHTPVPYSHTPALTGGKSGNFQMQTRISAMVFGIYG